jgi:hypothetical protein
MQPQPDTPDHRLFRRPSVRIRTRGHLHLDPFDVKHEAEGGHVRSAGHPRIIPLGALVIYAVGYDLRRRRRRDDPRSHDISTAARLARTNTDAHGASGLGQGTNVGGVGSGGRPWHLTILMFHGQGRG